MLTDKKSLVLENKQKEKKRGFWGEGKQERVCLLSYIWAAMKYEHKSKLKQLNGVRFSG